MPSAVRTRRLFGPTTFSSIGTVLYTVPVDRTAIIRSLTVRNNAATAAPFTIRINGVAWWSALLPADGSLAVPYCALDDGETLEGITPLAIHSCNAAGFGSLLVGDPS